MRLFLDTRVLLAASGSARGASREVFRLAVTHGWTLVATPCVVAEVLHNLPSLPDRARPAWERLRTALTIRDDIVTLDRAVVFPAGKDRPVLFSALAWADVLLTLDKVNFADLLDNEFYGLAVLTPGGLLRRERSADLQRGR